MTRYAVRGLLIALVTPSLMLISACSRDQNPDQPVVAESMTAHGNVELEWGRDLPAALERARAEDKPIVVNFYATWCVWCKRLEATTLSDTEVKTVLRDRTVTVSLDVDGDGRELSDIYRVDGLPTILVLDSSGREIGRIPGYMSPTGFLETVEDFLQQS